jgi:hypothetical protein
MPRPASLRARVFVEKRVGENVSNMLLTRSAKV